MDAEIQVHGPFSATFSGSRIRSGMAGTQIHKPFHFGMSEPQMSINLRDHYIVPDIMRFILVRTERLNYKRQINATKPVHR